MAKLWSEEETSSYKNNKNLIDNTDSLKNTIEYDYKGQTKIKETDPNGNYLKYTYDNWNRIKTLRTPYDSDFGTPAVLYEYYNEPNSMWYCVTENKVSFDSSNNDVITTVAEIDGLGRVARTAKGGLVYNNSAKVRGWNTSGAVEYDLAGRTVKEGMTTFVEGGSISSLLNSSIEMLNLFTSYEYDSLGRRVKTTLPDNSSSITTFRVDNGNLIYITTDSLGNITEAEKDSRGNIKAIRKLDNQGNLLTETSYNYSDMRELLSVVDAKGNAITSEYDMLGRRLALEGADFGRKTWEYDEKGNVVRSDNSVLRSKNQSIEYKYDTLGRLVYIDYPTLVDTQYIYGKGDETGFEGRLKQRIDSSGIVEYEYGKLGDTTKETKKLKSMIFETSGDLIEKTFGYKSNYLGQIEELTYPDGEVVKYGYDSAGQVEAVTGYFHSDITGDDVFEYVKNIGYDEYGQRAFIEYGNGVRSQYTYDPERRWLKNLKSHNSEILLQNLDYTFDTVGNVLKYTNDCISNNAGYTSVTQEYTYDNLYQLIEAKGDYRYSTYRDSYADKNSFYNQTFEYDSIGNLINKISRGKDAIYKASSDGLNYDYNYTYDNEYAHRLKQVKKMYFNYDENGNITAISDTSFEKKYDLEPIKYGDNILIYNYDITEPWTAPELPRKFGYQNNLVYDDRGMLKETCGGHEPRMLYIYDTDNKRTSKYNERDKLEYMTFNDYFGVFFSRKIKFEGGQWQKSIMLGDSRLVTRIDQKRSSTREYRDERTFYYLTDHLGSATLITDYKGNIYQATEYTPYGERWLERTKTPSDDYYMPFRFTGKPLDEETGYYYFGARYFRPRLSMWMTSDPAMGEYFDNANKGEGGVFNSINLNSYHYAGNNPIRYIDPTGREDEDNFSNKFKSYLNVTCEKVKTKSQEIYYKATEFHFEGRDAKNTDLPSFEYVDTEGKYEGWRPLPYNQSIYHQNRIGEPELKYVNDKTGKEAVYTSDFSKDGSYQLYTDPRYKGTYNYVTPSETPKLPNSITDFKGIKDMVEKTVKFAGTSVGHFVSDMLPYYLTGGKNERDQ